jgi:hypothetical protein
MFEETQSLLNHAFQCQKKGLRAEHLGLCKALCTIMGWNDDIDSADGTMTFQSLSAEEAKANREDLILWPPVVIIHSLSSKMGDGQHRDIIESSVSSLLKGWRSYSLALCSWPLFYCTLHFLICSHVHPHAHMHSYTQHLDMHIHNPCVHLHLHNNVYAYAYTLLN